MADKLRDGIDNLIDDTKIVGEIGSKTTYNPWGKNLETNEWQQLDTPINARVLNNGLLVHTKKEPREMIYAGNRGIYRMVDKDTGLLVGYAKNFDDALRISNDKEFVDKLNRARELHKKNRR